MGPVGREGLATTMSPGRRAWCTRVLWACGTVIVCLRCSEYLQASAPMLWASVLATPRAENAWVKLCTYGTTAGGAIGGAALGHLLWSPRWAGGSRVVWTALGCVVLLAGAAAAGRLNEAAFHVWYAAEHVPRLPPLYGAVQCLQYIVIGLAAAVAGNVVSGTALRCWARTKARQAPPAGRSTP